jgi:hypothetical protein
MKILIAKVLLVLMTLSGVVMPIYAYAHELVNCPDDQLTNVDNDYGSDSNKIICDHCCHFSSHSLGLMWVSSSIVDLEIKYIVIFQNQNYASYKQPPPYQPPIFNLS